MKMNRDEQEAKLINSNSSHSHNNATNSSLSSLDEAEETRQRIESWMGLGSNRKKVTTKLKHATSTTTSTIKSALDQSSVSSLDEQQLLVKPNSSSTCSSTDPQTPPPTHHSDMAIPPSTNESPSGLVLQRPKGILKAPKYSNPNVMTMSSSGVLEDVSRPQLSSSAEDEQSNVPPSPPPVQGRVLERLHPVAQPLPQRRIETPSTSLVATDATLAIEGYTPLTATTMKLKEPKVSFREQPDNSTEDEDDDDHGNDDNSDASSIILSSMEDLFEMAQRGRTHQLQQLQQKRQQQQLSLTDESSSLLILNRSLATLETDLEFSCLTPEEYEEIEHVPEEERRQLQEEEQRLHFEAFVGRTNAFDNFNTDGDDDDGEATEHFVGGGGGHVLSEPNFLLHHANGDDDDDDQALIDVSQPQDDENDMDDEDDNHVLEEEDNQAAGRQPEVRSFLLLWTAITQWVTPQTVAILEEWKEQQDTHTTNAATYPRKSHVLATVADRSDVEASRCAGLQAMLKMNLPRVMDELHQPQELRRFLDIHLAELLSTFDYTYPISVKMDMDMWRAMTCVFVDMVLMFSSKEQQSKCAVVVNQETTKPANSGTKDNNVDNENRPNHDNTKLDSRTFPESAQAAGLKVEEYRYLVRSAITTLGARQEQE